MNDKDDYWYRMDLEDLNSAGAFVEKDIWDKFVVKSQDKVVMQPRDYTK